MFRHYIPDDHGPLPVVDDDDDGAGVWAERNIFIGAKARTRIHTEPSQAKWMAAEFCIFRGVLKHHREIGEMQRM